MKVKPRRPYPPIFDDEPTGYLESDRDYLDNNNELAVKLLDEQLKRELSYQAASICFCRFCKAVRKLRGD